MFILLEELCITRIAAVNSFARVLNPREGSVNIVIHRQTVSLYHNTLEWLDPLDSSSWDRKLPNFHYIYIYIIACVCVCVCVFIYRNMWGIIQIKNISEDSYNSPGVLKV